MDIRKMGINLAQDETIALLGTYPSDTLYYYKNTCSNMFIATKFFIARLWKQPRCHQLIKDKKCGIFVQYNITLQLKNEIKKCADKWMK